MKDELHCIIEKVIQYSAKPETRKKLEDFLRKYQPELLWRGDAKAKE